VCDHACVLLHVCVCMRACVLARTRGCGYAYTYACVGALYVCVSACVCFVARAAAGAFRVVTHTHELQGSVFAAD